MNDISMGTPRPAGAWSAATWLSVGSLTLASFSIVSSELLPMGLLTPMAGDIGVSEGAAGQTVTLTALLAGFAAPTVAMVIGRLDRKVVTLGLLALVVISNLLVAFATDYLVLLAARMLLGVAIGGFFALVAATVVRLVTLASMGKGMSMVFFGLSAATVAAPPLGALIGAAFGWRTAFLVAAGAGAVAFIALGLCLPRVPASGATSLKSLFGLFGRSKIRVGLLVVLLFFGGHFAGFTFIRPYLETGAKLDVGAVAAVLFVYGIATLAGNALGGIAADRVLRGGFAITCALIGVATLGLVAVGTQFLPALGFAAIWGFAAGAIPVMVQTWMGRAAPDALEGVGGLFLAVIQFAIAIGAIMGGIAVDLYGVSVPLYLTAVGGLLAAALIATQRSPAVSQPAE